MARPVICGVDEAAGGAIRVARELAERYGLSLLYVHVQEGLTTRERLDGLRRAAAQGGAEIAVERGHPADRLVEVAREQDAAFLVVGCRGPRSSLLGSISADVSRRAPCPVVVVPSTARAERDLGGVPKPDLDGGIVRFRLGDATSTT